MYQKKQFEYVAPEATTIMMTYEGCILQGSGSEPQPWFGEVG